MSKKMGNFPTRKCFRVLKKNPRTTFRVDRPASCESHPGRIPTDSFRFSSTVYRKIGIQFSSLKGAVHDRKVWWCFWCCFQSLFVLHLSGDRMEISAPGEKALPRRKRVSQVAKSFRGQRLLFTKYCRLEIYMEIPHVQDTFCNFKVDFSSFLVLLYGVRVVQSYIFPSLDLKKVIHFF